MCNTQTRRFGVEEVNEAVSRTTVKLAKAEGESVRRRDSVRPRVKDVLVSLLMDGRRKTAF